MDYRTSAKMKENYPAKEGEDKTIEEIVIA
jgi:hypothetical protein